MKPCRIVFLSAAICCLTAVGQAAETNDLEAAYFQDGELAGSLKSDAPLPLYDADPGSLANRLFAAFYIRTSEIPTKRGDAPVRRIEGGDVIDFLAWSGSDYWSSPKTCQRLSSLLDECLAEPARWRPADPLHRAMLQRDLWAPFDFLVGGNIARSGDKATRERRDEICRKLAAVIRLLTLSPAEISRCPTRMPWPSSRGDLPPSIVRRPPSTICRAAARRSDEWQEIDFFQPSDIHEDIQERFVTLHTRNYKGRSYFRVFYRFPGGRPALEEYFKYVDAEGIDWKRDAQRGFVNLRGGLRQIPSRHRGGAGAVYDHARRPVAAHAHADRRIGSAARVSQRRRQRPNRRRTPESA